MTQADDAIEPSDLAELAVFPLPNAVLFPGAHLPLHIFEPRYREMIRDVLGARRRLAIARLRPGFEQDYYARPAVFEICGLGAVIEHRRRDDGRYDILVRGLSRVRLVEELSPTRSYRLFRAELLHDDAVADAAALAAWQQKLRALWERLGPHLAHDARDLRALTGDGDDPGLNADRIAEAIVVDPDERQRFLEQLDPLERFSHLITRLDQLVASLSPEGNRPSYDVN